MDASRSNGLQDTARTAAVRDVKAWHVLPSWGGIVDAAAAIETNYTENKYTKGENMRYSVVVCVGVYLWSSEMR
jgi:hypothetical protein